MTHICVSKIISIGSHNGLSPGRRQAIIWTNAGISLIWPLGTNFSEILIGIHTFTFKKMHLKLCLENGSHFVSASMCQPVAWWCHMDGLVQDCSNSIANALELLQSCTKPSMWCPSPWSAVVKAHCVLDGTMSITPTNVDKMTNYTFKDILQWNMKHNTFFCWKLAYENIICKTSASPFCFCSVLVSHIIWPNCCHSNGNLSTQRSFYPASALFKA